MRRWAFRLVILIATIAVFRVTLLFIPPAAPTPSWSSASGDPVPPEFCYVMFPASTSVPMRDAPPSSPTSKPIGTLQRAVVNSQEEIDAGGWVAVQSSSSVGWVQIDDLIYLPPAASTTDLFGGFVAAYRALDSDPFCDASFDLSQTPGGPTIANLRLRDDDHWQEYRYEITPAGPRPIEMYKVFGPALAMEDLGRVVIAAAAALGFLAVAITAVVIVSLRKQRHELRTPASGGSTLIVR
jgi:hypothetical protein